MRAAPSPLGILTAATLAALTSAQEQAPARAPNSLTPEEIAQGWILLFDGATSFGWSVEGEVGVAQGALVLGGEEPTHAHSTTAFEWSGNHTFSAELEVRWEGEEPPRIQPFGDSIGWLTLNESSRMEWTPQRMTATKRFSLNPSPPHPRRFEVPAGRVLEGFDVFRVEGREGAGSG